MVHGDADFAGEVTNAVSEAACALAWRPELADEIVAMRERMEASRGAHDLKRGPGGVVDVEFLMQLFQLKYGREQPALRKPNTWEALDALLASGLLSAEEHAALQTGYNFLRRVQGRLRIVHNRLLDELPEGSEEVDKLARRLGYETGALFWPNWMRIRRRYANYLLTSSVGSAIRDEPASNGVCCLLKRSRISINNS